MIAAWMLSALLVAALVGAAGRAAEEAAALLGRPRRWVWAAALPLSALLPLAAPRLPWRGLLPGPGGAGTSELGRLLEALGARVPGSGLARSGAWTAPGLDLPLLLVWMAASGAVLALLLRAHLATRTLRRRCRPTRLHGVPVLLGDGAGPAVVGLLHPAIVVPRWVLPLPEAEGRLVLEHEAEHLAARDPWMLAAGALCLAAMPWCLPLWWQHRRLRCAVETDCDARVLARGADPRDYGRVLLRTAGRPSAPRSLAPTLVGAHTLLERRILAMTAKTPRHRVARSAGLATGSLALLLAACELSSPPVEPGTPTEPAPRTADEAPDAPDARTTARTFPRTPAPEGLRAAAPSAGSPRVLEGTTDGTPPIVLLDGEEIGYGELDGLDPARIERIEVIKGAAARERFGDRAPGGIVEIVTKKP